MIDILYGNAICYSGFREGQSPHTGVYPTYDEVKEDLFLLEKDYKYIRMYAPNMHAKLALEVIRNENINLKVLLGIDLLGEISNPNCTWGGLYTDDEIEKNIKYNEKQLQDLIFLANEYEDVIFAVSAGNESVPEWNENLVSPQRVLYFVRELKKCTNQLVTYCENVNYWDTILRDVASEVDFISIHTYPVWIGVDITNSLEASIEDYDRIKSFYPDKLVVITEAGWPTCSNGASIKKEVANIKNHNIYIEKMQNWSKEKEVIIFFFEAFDEPWKGGNDPLEPEKHWGFYDVSRNLK